MGFAADNLELAEIAWVRDFDTHRHDTPRTVSIGLFTFPDSELGRNSLRASDAQSTL